MKRYLSRIAVTIALGLTVLAPRLTEAAQVIDAGADHCGPQIPRQIGPSKIQVASLTQGAAEDARFYPQHTTLAGGLISQALVYQAFQNYEEAQPLFELALDIKQLVLGPCHRDVAASLADLAQLYTEQGRYDEAEPLFREALQVRQQALGSEHSDVAWSLRSLAVLHRYQGRYDEAEPLFKRALAIDEKAVGDEHPNIARSLYQLALLYDLQGGDAEAEPLYQQALEIVEASLPQDHPWTLDILRDFARFLRDINRPAEALALEARAKETRHLGPSGAVPAF